MKIYISYFYKVRFMKSNLLPVSTAKWDPDWFHHKPGTGMYDFKTGKQLKNYGLYLDKNNVLNGMRIENLVFPEEKFNELKSSNTIVCTPTCSYRDCIDSKNWCPFMIMYKEYLDGLNFDDMIFLLKTYVENYKYQYNVKGNVDVVLLVHEPSACKCAERPVLKKWFKEHGVTLHEWQGGK